MLFGALVWLRTRMYAWGLLRQHRIGKPVIVIGNLSVGGTGKTPLVVWLVEQLQAQGRRPGIALRGYRGRAAATMTARLVQPDSDAGEVGDEALLLRLRTGAPVAIGRDRVQAAHELVRQGVDVIVCDDGLQHLRLARDHEVVVIDAARGLGNGYLLPAGPLRESAARLRRVDSIVLNGEGAVTDPTLGGIAPIFVMRLVGDQIWPLLGTGEPASLAQLAGKRVHAVAGIGNPQRFFSQLVAAGLDVIGHPFPDHHRFQASELRFGDELPLLMTEKDAVKCRGLAVSNCWYLPVAASFAPEQRSALLARLQPILSR